jgi:methylmalonyl-CoA/ethylmalonyl-CoA epimerase
VRLRFGKKEQPSMKIKRIAHLGVAVNDLDAALKFFTQGLPLEVTHTEDYQGMKIGFLPVGDSSIELLQDASGSSAIRKFLDKNGEGIHHIAFEVDDIHEAVAELKERGIKLIDETPRPGAHGMSIAFMHPKATHGILMELVQPGEGSH